MTRSGTTLVLMPPEISPTLSLGEPMPGDFALGACEPLPFLVERREDRSCGLQRVGAGLGHGRVSLTAAHGHLEMQQPLCAVTTE